MIDRPQPKRYNDTKSPSHHPKMNPEQFSGDSTTLYRIQSGGADARRDAVGDHREFEKNTGLYYEKLRRDL